MLCKPHFSLCLTPSLLNLPFCFTPRSTALPLLHFPMADPDARLSQYLPPWSFGGWMVRSLVWTPGSLFPQALHLATFLNNPHVPQTLCLLLLLRVLNHGALCPPGSYKQDSHLMLNLQPSSDSLRSALCPSWQLRYLMGVCIFKTKKKGGAKNQPSLILQVFLNMSPGCSSTQGN